MGRHKTIERRKPLFINILEAQDRDLRFACKKIGISLTDAVGEALQYWLSAQRKLGVFKDGE